MERLKSPKKRVKVEVKKRRSMMKRRMKVNMQVK